MAYKVFIVKEKSTGKATRIVKAETRGQVNKFLNKLYEIEAANALEIAELLGTTDIKLETAEFESDETSAKGASSQDVEDEQLEQIEEVND